MTYTHYQRLHVPTGTIATIPLPLHEGQESLSLVATLALINEWNRQATLQPTFAYHYWVMV